MTQKFQTPSQVEQSLFTVDRIRRCILTYDETLLRGCTDEARERDADTATIGSPGTADRDWTKHYRQ
eukprot:5131633-Amphidinium_carterae.1